MKTLLSLLLLTLLSFSSTSIAKPELEKTSDSDFMIELVGNSRATNCHTPFTQTEREHLSTDPMVVIGGKLKQWIKPNEFPAFLDVINATMNCNSAQWVKDMNHQLATSMKFKAKLDQIRYEK